MRTLSPEEQATLQRLVRSRTAPARLVERAQTVSSASQGEPIPAIARCLGLDPRTVVDRLHRCNEQGLTALEDRPRSGRPPTYTTEQIGEVIATALTDPQSLGLPFACWTLDRLQAYLNEERSIGIKGSRIDGILLAEGWKMLRSFALKGRRFETWEEVCQAIEEASQYWNRHRHPYVWGRRRRHRPRRQPGLAFRPPSEPTPPIGAC